MKKLFLNKRLLIAVIAIILVVVFAACEWGRALKNEYEVVALYDVSGYSEELGSRLSLYELPFKHVFLFTGIVFGSAALLLSALSSKER